jgi:hypothetical protein
MPPVGMCMLEQKVTLNPHMNLFRAQHMFAAALQPELCPLVESGSKPDKDGHVRIPDWIGYQNIDWERIERDRI